MTEHGDDDLSRAAYLPIIAGDPKPAPKGSRETGRRGGKCGGRPRAVMPHEQGRYVLLEELTEHYGARKRLMVKVACRCGLSAPRIVQRADWARDDFARACRACKGKGWQDGE